MKALTYLSSKSVEIRTKEKKEEMAEEENDTQGGVCEEDEDFGIDLDSEDDEDWDLDEDADEITCLYRSPLDDVDEVMFLAECLQKLQASSGEMYNYLMGQLDGDEINLFNSVMAYVHSQ